MADPTKKAAPKSKAPAEKAKPAAAKAPGEKKPVRADAGKATPAAPEGQRCSVDKCKQPERAKGLCRKHYIAWRRGEFGKKHRYNICGKEGCRKPAQFSGFCEEHKKGAETKAA
jgi:hypothetical protein